MNTKYSIKNYLDFLENKRNELEKHPSPYCEKCHGTGEAEIYMPMLKRSVTATCDCIFNEDLENTKEKISRTKNMLSAFHNAFGTLDDDLSFEKYKNIYEVNIKVVDLLEKYLTHHMDNAILLTGESGAGKTTMLKMAWQILMLNKKNVYYLACPMFEELYHKEYRLDGVSEKIERIINSIKNVEYIFLDDHIFTPHKNMLSGYYRIFDNARAFKQKIIMASNKSFDEVVRSYASKDSIMAARLQTRLENLNLVECEVLIK